MSTKTIAEKSSVKKIDIKRLAVTSMFIAMGYICVFVFRFHVSFLTLEFKDVFITMAGFVYGPITSVIVAFIEALLEMFTVSGTGFWGALMNFAGSATFAVTASIIYKYNKNFKGAVIGLTASVFTMTAVMIVMNLFVTPIYAHVDMKTVTGMILPLLLPFNLIKSLLNSAITFIIYKPISQALKNIHVIPKNDDDYKINKNTVIAFAVAAVMIAVSIAVVMVIFSGEFELIKSK